MTTKVKTQDVKQTTLDDTQIETNRNIGRRNVLRGAGVLGLGAVGVRGCLPAGTSVTDSDNGPIIDPVGFGRGGATRSL